jgi:hypothetical protein
MVDDRVRPVVRTVMNGDLRKLIDSYDGVATRAMVLAELPGHVLDHAVHAGHLARLLPRVYVDPARLAEPRTRARAALAYAGPDTALSHITALGVWRLPGGHLAGPVHVLVDWHRRLRGAPGLVVHRRMDFVSEQPEVVVRSGLPTCRLERSVVDSWPLLAPDVRRAAVINAVGDRLTTPERLREAIAAHPSLPGRAELLRLAWLLERGCRSVTFLPTRTGPG